MKPVDFFSRDVHTFWATTFQFDLKLFDQFLLRRLGSDPLNGVVLCDEGDLTETLAELSDVDRHVAANANRRYLLRGMRVPSGGRFHPKTYLFASRRRTILLVGSGNLTRSGLDRGAETFVSFDAAADADQSVIRAWAAWIRELVELRGDQLLRKRYEHLRATVPAVAGPAEQNTFFTNGRRPFIDLLAEQRPAAVTELHVSAPYFDERALALRELIDRIAPTKAIHVYLGDRPSVDGPALAEMLRSTDVPATVYRFDPPRFVHAKLIGLVGPEDGMLACGSANLSHAALDRIYEEPGSWGNCEALALRRGSADEVRSAFRPPESTFIEIELDDVVSFRYESNQNLERRDRLRILSATLDDQRAISILTDGDVGADMQVRIDDADVLLPLEPKEHRARTEPLPEALDPLVIVITDASGAAISNVVVLDDPQALEAVLGERSAKSDRPDELVHEDERSELVALLAWAHRQFIFDLDDTPALQRARQSAEAASSESSDFWERYAREELSYDQRSQSYRPLGAGGGAPGTELLLREVEAMLHAAPHERRLRLVRGATDDGGREAGSSGHVWSLSARQQLRARNLVRRWARALPDPRHAWLAPEAPARNYEALIEVLALIWLGDALERDRIVELLGEIWTGLLGSDSRRGLFDRADPEFRDEVLDSVNDDVRELAAGLAYAALCEPGWTGFIYDWQLFLVRGIEHGLFIAGDLACGFVEAVADDNPSEGELEGLLLQRAQYMDDTKWAEQLASELDLRSIRLVRGAHFKNVELVVEAAGMDDPARDPRTVVLARRAMSFRKRDHVLLDVDGQRFLLRLGETARARIGDRTHESVEPVVSQRLAAVEAQGGTLADVLGIAAA